jgi:Immunity protein 51
MANFMRLVEIDGSHRLTLDCGRLPADQSIIDSGHEPNGYFWEGVATFLDAELVAALELESERGMFCVYGDQDRLGRLRSLMEPFIGDGERMAALIRDAEGQWGPGGRATVPRMDLMPPELATLVESIAQPVVAIRPGQEPTDPTSSYAAGHPYLPANVAWPTHAGRAMAFVC